MNINLVFKEIARKNSVGFHQHRPTKRAPDAGDCPKGVRKSQAVSCVFSFSWLDGFAVPAPGPVV
jgi:hypothetical protein